MLLALSPLSSPFLPSPLACSLFPIRTPRQGADRHTCGRCLQDAVGGLTLCLLLRRYHQEKECGGPLSPGGGGVCRSPELHLQIRRQVQQVSDQLTPVHQAPAAHRHRGEKLVGGQ